MIKGSIGVECQGKSFDIVKFSNWKSIDYVLDNLLGRLNSVEEVFISNVKKSNLIQAFANAYLNISLDDGVTDVESLKLYLTLLSYKISHGNCHKFILFLVDTKNNKSIEREIIIDDHGFVFQELRLD